MIYREYQQNDRDELKRLLFSLQDFFVRIDDEYREFNNDDAEKYLDEILCDVDDKDGKIFLAIDGNKIIGFIQGVIIEKDDLQHVSQLEGWIGLLFVDESYRNKKVGNDLVAKICEYFNSKNCDVVKLFCSNTNTNAFNFYKKYGFEISNVELTLKNKRLI